MHSKSLVALGMQVLYTYFLGGGGWGRRLILEVALASFYHVWVLSCWSWGKGLSFVFPSKLPKGLSSS